MPIKHATQTAVPDDPAYDVGSDEWNASHSVDSVTVTGGTVTASTPVFDATQTWNSGAVTFTASKINVTDTASAAGSLLADWQVGGISQVWARKDGVMAARIICAVYDSNWQSALFGYHLYLGSTGVVKFADGVDPLANTPDTGLSRASAGVLEVNTATAGTLRDIKARNVITPGVTVANLAGAAQGARSFVTDATQTLTAGIGAVVAGGGTNAVPVVYDGTNWRIG